jgi:inorganic pyrophosphatase
MNSTIANDGVFWDILDNLVDSSAIVVDRPKGSAHPRLPDMVYPLDYGYLSGTTAGDGQGIDVWIGSEDNRQVTGIACTADTWKRDAEIKLMLGCTSGEADEIRRFLAAHGLGCVVITRYAAGAQ